MMLSALPPVLDVDQVAELCRCASKTVQQLARDGELPGVKLGEDWVFPVGALLARLDEKALQEAAARRKPATPSPAPMPVATLHQLPGATRRGKAPRPRPVLPNLG